MATAYKSVGAGEKFCKRHLPPEINEDPQNVSQQAERNGVEEQIASPAVLLKTSVASLQHPATMENLPDELLINIFIRLLAKQLSQMRSVSKSWNALLSHSSFKKSHLHHSIYNKDQILLVFHNIHSNFQPFTTFSCRSPNLKLTNFIKLPVNPLPEYPLLGVTNGIWVIGCANGLICSSYESYDSHCDSIIHIWNPSLSAVLTLPPYLMPACDYNSIKVYFWFGFDPKTNDYKVVKLMGFSGPSTHDVKWWLQVEVFSMKKGSWKLITERFPSHITGIIYDDGVCIDGHLHWLGFIHNKSDSERIVVFDLAPETFREIPLPNTIQNYKCVNMLGVLAGKLCVISQFGDGPCEVWMMDEYGVVESWVKRHVFSHFIGKIISYGFTSHGDFLLSHNDCFILYDPIAKNVKIMEKSWSRRGGAYKIVEYVDSLVWVAPDKHEMVDGARQN